jgi:hypothetical protein
VKGNDGGYTLPGLNGDTSTDMSIRKGSGGGGGSSASNYGGGGGGGAGGGCVALVSDGNLTIDGTLTSTGGGGGTGGQDVSGNGGNGGGGGGGGILLMGLKVAVTGSIDARGRLANTPSLINGGTVKIFYEMDLFSSASIQAGKMYISGRPRMQGLISPVNGGTAPMNTDFVWKNASDPDGGPVTYHIQIANNPAFAPTEISAEGINGTSYTSQKALLGATFYWRVRARDDVGYGSWSET